MNSSVNVLFYEINEVPWRVVDAFVAKHPQSHWAQLLKTACQRTTVTRDEGELHPWTTWPTVHRGVYNTTHGITFLNQQLPNAWPPIWETLAQHGIRCGVFGSLQSYPVPSRSAPSHEATAFYVPDTFSPTAHTHPVALEAFQRFNLRQTKQDGAQAAAVALNGSVIGDVWGMTKSGLRLSTLGKLGLHLLKERINSDHKTYRSILQAGVAFDFYEKLLKQTQPQFSTFFTNHVAGMMHRYWKQAFPEDFQDSLVTPRDSFLSLNIERAMMIVDKQLEFLLEYCQNTQTTLFVLSSMGQEAVHRDAYLGEYRLEDVAQFTRALRYDRPLTNNLAMQPDFAFSFENKNDLTLFKGKVGHLTDENQVPLFSLKESGLTLNLNLKASAAALTSESLLWGETVFSAADLGLKKLQRDPGTGYHQPQGICLIHGPDVKSDNARTEIESVQILPTVLKMFGIETPDYCAPPFVL